MFNIRSFSGPKWEAASALNETVLLSISISCSRYTLRELASNYTSNLRCLNRVRGSPAYDLIRDKLTKKGLLRKLVEHLSSHRNYLNDCAQTNLRIMSDSSMFNFKVVGLVVSNTLIQNLEAFEAVILQPR